MPRGVGTARKSERERDAGCIGVPYPCPLSGPNCHGELSHLCIGTLYGEIRAHSCYCVGFFRARTRRGLSSAAAWGLAIFDLRLGDSRDRCDVSKLIFL